MKFNVNGPVSFRLEVIEALEKVGINAKREEEHEDNIIGKTERISFTIYPHFDFTIPTSIVRLVVKGEGLEVADYEKIQKVISDSLGLEPETDLISGKKVSLYWKGTNY